jgi:Family of unknown function (DUF5681)
MKPNNGEKKPHGNPAIADAGVATRFKPGQSANPNGRPPRTPYADAHRRVAELSVAELENSPDDSVVIRSAKAVARDAMKGNIPAAVEAANRTEGKHRELVEQDAEQRMDLATFQRKIREAYGLPGLNEVEAENPLPKREDAETEDATTNSSITKEPNNDEQKHRGNPGIVEAGVATRFKPGRSANPGGKPGRTPYADAYRMVAEMPAANLQVFPSDSVATGIAKAVSLQGMSGKISAVVEAANRTEGKPREIEEPPIEKHDLAYTLKCIRLFYGIEDPEERDAEIIVTRNRERESEGLITNNEETETHDISNGSPLGSSKDKPE